MVQGGNQRKRLKFLILFSKAAEFRGFSHVNSLYLL